MPKKIRETLSLDVIFNLIEVPGELGAAIKRQKLQHPHANLVLREEEYKHCASFRQFITAEKGRSALLEILFHDLPELAFNQLHTADCYQIHEFFDLKYFLYSYQKIREVLKSSQMAGLHPLPGLSKVYKLLDPEGNKVSTFRISPLYSPSLAALLQQQFQLSQQLQAQRFADLETARQELGIPHLKEEFVLSRQRSETLNKLMASKHFILVYESLANCSFRLADSALALTYKAKLQHLGDQLEAEETEVLTKLTTQLKEHLQALEQAWHSCAELLWDFSLAQFADRYQCCIPRLDESFGGIHIKSAVNLPLKLYLIAHQGRYQSLDFCFASPANLLTGPNMGGKSTALVTLGQLCYLAKLGIPLPATEAKLPLYDEVYYNHDSGESSETLSSFGREVVSLTQMLSRKGTKLILLDEFAKGTNPAEGEAICVATLKYLCSTTHTVVAATHFTAPTLLADLAHYQIKGISESSFTRLEDSDPEISLELRLKLLSEAMDYSLEPSMESKAPAQCAIRIARLLGLPEGILTNLTQE